MSVAVRFLADFVKRQPRDVDNALRVLDAELHEIDQRRAAGEKANAGALLGGFGPRAGRDSRSAILCANEIEGLHDQAAPALACDLVCRTCWIALTMFG